MVTPWVPVKYGKFVLFRNNLNGFWDFYHGNTVGADSQKAVIEKLRTRFSLFCDFLPKRKII